MNFTVFQHKSLLPLTVDYFAIEIRVDVSLGNVMAETKLL